MRVFATSSKISIYVVENILRQNIFQEILEFIFFCAPGIRVFAASRHSCMFEVQNIFCGKILINKILKLFVSAPGMCVLQHLYINMFWFF